MSNEQIAPVAESELTCVFIALELSRSKWLVGDGGPHKKGIGRHVVAGGDFCSLLQCLEQIGASEERRSGRPVRLHICFEAGRDGHWLYRALKQAGYDVYEIDPASVCVNRRARRAKSDGLDVESLVRTLGRLLRGEQDACSLVRVPTEEEEDGKRPEREYERLVKEQGSHSNRIVGLLFGQGIRDFNPLAADRLERLAELSIQPNLKAELRRECLRLAEVARQLAEIEVEINAAVSPKTKHSPARGQAVSLRAVLPEPMRVKAQALVRLRGIGPHFSTVLGCEVYYRHFQNRRAVGQYIGLSPAPFQSGDMAHDQGIAKAGNRRARKAMIEMAWFWLRYQPDSALSQWFRHRVGDQKGRVRRIAIVAMARKLAVALWRYLETGVVPEGAVLKPF